MLYAGSHKPAGRGCAGRALSKCHVLLQSLVHSQPQRLRAARPARPAGAELRRGHRWGLGPATAAGCQIWAAPASSGAAGTGSGQHATRAPAQYAAEHIPGTAPQRARRAPGTAMVPGGWGSPASLSAACRGWDTTGHQLLTPRSDLPPSGGVWQGLSPLGQGVGMNGCGEVSFDPTSTLLPPGRVGFC